LFKSVRVVAARSGTPSARHCRQDRSPDGACDVGRPVEAWVGSQ